MSSPARRAVLRSQLEISEELGHAFVEVPTDLLRELLGAFDISAELRQVFAAIAEERARQEQLAAANGWKSCAAMQGDDELRFVVLGEEVGEVARAILESGGGFALQTELVHVAAVASAWLEAELAEVPAPC